MSVPVPPAGRTAGLRRRLAMPRAATHLPAMPLAAFAVAVLVLAGCGTGGRAHSDAGRPSGANGTAIPTDLPGVPAISGSASQGTSAGTATIPYQPLWPFASVADARAWQAGNRSGGAEAWRLDPAATALSFARDFLGFGEVDRALGRRVTGDDAHVEVGYPTEGTRTGVAAVVHLIRFGSGNDAPWEAVGTDDTILSLSLPAYASTVRGPTAVGGRISGVDESIRVQVRATSGSNVGQIVGESCCQPAGGDNSTWTASVNLTDGQPGQGLVVIASTGGHLRSVERFAVTGVRLAG